MESKRYYGLDLIRVIACYLVIQVHAGEFYYIGANGAVMDGYGPFWVGIINSLCRIAVPLFVMVSGYLLLPLKGEVSVFFRKRFTRVVIPFVIWCLLYALYWAAKGQTSWLQAGINILHIPVNFGTEVGHLWYVYMLIGLYLFIPVISPWVASASRKGMELYLVLWAVALCVPYIHLVFPQILGECYWNQTPLLYYFSGFLGYLILGAFIKKYSSEREDWNLPAGLLLILSGYAITAWGFLSRLDSALVTDLELTWGFETINVAMMSLGVFLLLKNVQPGKTSSPAARLVNDVSKLSYGIYLVHIMVLFFFYGLINPLIEAVWLKIPVIAVCTFVFSYLIIKLLSRLPKSSYITG